MGAGILVWELGGNSLPETLLSTFICIVLILLRWKQGHRAHKELRPMIETSVLKLSFVEKSSDRLLNPDSWASCPEKLLQ